jgi:Uri superfamily endonuclease
MSNREKENHKKYIKKTLKDIKNTKIDITKKIKILEANNLTNSKIRNSNTLYRFLNERPERVKPKRFLKNFKTVENKPKILNQKNKWHIDYLKREISRYEGNINILDRKEKKAINEMKKNGESIAKIKNRTEIFNRNKRPYRLKLNKAKKDLKNIMP